MRTHANWLRNCESQKLAHDTARLEERMRDRYVSFTCYVCGDPIDILTEDYRGQFDQTEAVCEDCKENER